MYHNVLHNALNCQAKWASQLVVPVEVLCSLPVVVVVVVVVHEMGAFPNVVVLGLVKSENWTKRGPESDKL